jgi:hypothetical protein
MLSVLGRRAESLPLFDAYVERWPDSLIALNAAAAAATAGDWKRFETYVAKVGESAIGSDPEAQLRLADLRAHRHRDAAQIEAMRDRVRRLVAKTGWAPLGEFTALHEFGLTEEAFELAGRSSFEFMFDPEGPSATGNRLGVLFSDTARELQRDARFVALCAKLGLVGYWLDTGRWPDCADDVPYDFRAECRRLDAEGLARRV